MLTLFSYPSLFGVADNNPYGMKVYAFLKLCKLSFRHEHILDASHAPRGQLPYLKDGEAIIGDSDAIIAHLIASRGLFINEGLSIRERTMDHLIRRTLDDLYWVMSYSRWKDERFWPLFLDAFLTAHPDVPRSVLETARAYNFTRYHYQGIGRYDPEAVYARGVADLAALADLVPAAGYIFGSKPRSCDAVIYGFLANILFYEIETPLKAFLISQSNLVAYCQAVGAALAP